MKGAQARLVRIENEIRHALTHGEFKVHYQPIMQTAVDGEARTLAGFEALVRWQHPRRGLIGPEQFLKEAEELGFAQDIARQMIADAIRQLGVWQRTFRCGQQLFVAVNIPEREMLDKELVEEIRLQLAREQVDPQGLRLELSQSMLFAIPSQVRESMHKLRMLGVSLCCSQFGAGNSALTYLKYLPFDALKTDRSLLKAGGKADWHIMQAIVVLGHGLNMSVIADGVRDDRQLEILESIGCDMAQGWPASKVLAPADILNAMSKARRMAPLEGRLEAISSIILGKELAPTPRFIAPFTGPLDQPTATVLDMREVLAKSQKDKSDGPKDIASEKEKTGKKKQPRRKPAS
jgi:EAL domain-containing protein (putative c-di-GMP-specific phosphodiesterase class I)